MELPAFLKTALDEYSDQYSLTELKKAAQNVSETYRNSKRFDLPLVTKDIDVVAYALARMPATFAAVSTVLKNIEPCQTMLDIGAGTGAATWAALEMGKAKSVICLEKEEKMREFGSKLIKKSNPSVSWQSFDLKKDLLPQRAELVVSSYVLNELNEKGQLEAAEKLWQVTEKNLVIIEPGTPTGFGIIHRIRKHLLEKGAFITAPCPHNEDCPLSKNDWCHFTCRLARTQVHRILKGGDAPYEDEKFSYLILSRQPVSTLSSRILRHPFIEKGNVRLQLCTQDGIKTRIVTRKEKELFKTARKSNAGDVWNE